MKNHNNHRNELTLFSNYGTSAVYGSYGVSSYSATSQVYEVKAVGVQASGTATGSQDTRESHFEGGYLIRKGLKFQFLNFTPIVLERKEEKGKKKRFFLFNLEPKQYISSLSYKGIIYQGNLKGEIWTFDFPPGRKKKKYALYYWENGTYEIRET